MKTSCIKFLSATLAVAMILGSMMSLASCAETAEEPKDTVVTKGEAGTVSEEEETRFIAYDSISKEKFGGREFTILSRDDMKEQYEVEKITGEILNDLVYERNTVVSEDLDIEFVVIDGGPYDQVISKLIQQVSTQGNDYDMYTGHKVAFMNCVPGNYLYDLNTIDTMDLTKPYWDQACRQDLSLLGKNFMMTGDIDPASMLISACFVFNKELNEELGKTEPYELVDNGQWTLDTYLTQVKDVSQDLNNDGVMSYENDRFSNTIWSLDGGFSMFYGAGAKFVTINDLGEPELTYNSEHVINIYEKLYKAIVTEKAFWLSRDEIGSYGVNYAIFTSGRALYCDITLSKITSMLADMETDYGIVPVPKYDEAQPEYLSFVNGSSPFVMVAQNAKDVDFIGSVLEAMAAYNYDNITPKMFEIVTKLQSARDPDSSRMVDYIIRNRIYDFGYFIELEITNAVMNAITKQKENIASDLKSNDRAGKNALKNLMKKFNEK